MQILPKTVDVLVVGAGINGATCAAEISRRGASVLLLEKEDAPAREGSGRAQGALRLQGRNPCEFPLARETMDLWRQAATETSEQDDFELVFGGNIYICDDEKEFPLLRRLVAEAHACGLHEVALLTPEQARVVIPAAEGEFVGAMWSPVDGHCNPEKATRFFVRKAQAAGTQIAYGVKALKILQSAGKVIGLKTNSGTIAASAIVVAAGAWTPYLAHSAGLNVPIMPVILSELETSPLPLLFDQTIRAFRFGGFQRPNGRLVISRGLNAVVAHSVTLYDLNNLRLWAPRLKAFRKDVRLSFDFNRTVEQIRRRSALSTDLIPDRSPEPPADRASTDAALTAFQKLIPAMRGATAERHWGGVVDMSPDGLPIIDGSAGPQGLSFVTGLSGHGFTLGPVMGQILADLALTGRSSRPIDAFRLGRFSDGSVPAPTKMI